MNMAAKKPARRSTRTRTPLRPPHAIDYGSRSKPQLRSAHRQDDQRSPGRQCRDRNRPSGSLRHSPAAVPLGVFRLSSRKHSKTFADFSRRYPPPSAEGQERGRRRPTASGGELADAKAKA